MAHRFSFEPGFVEIIHTGRVTYADRLAALTEIAANPHIGDQTPVLINFTGANIDVEHNHVDYMARVITSPFFSSRRVAMVGLPTEQARPAWTAAAIRKVAFRLFVDTPDAVAWLTSQD